MPNVFISYSHVSPDQDLASRLVGSLEANGVTVFVDTKIRIGEDWVEQIDRQLRNSQYFVVLLSAASIQSIWCGARLRWLTNSERRSNSRYFPCAWMRRKNCHMTSELTLI
ncbi:MAG: toll/interleukin-1 receptor domain-containing protein [Bryobacteraceae bacterium]